MDKLAHESEGGVYELPRAKIDGCPLDMSFSGLKTAVVNLAHNAEQTGKQLDRAALARDFTQAVVDELVPRAMLAMQQSGRQGTRRRRRCRRELVHPRRARKGVPKARLPALHAAAQALW